VERACAEDPSLAVAHGCFWRLHPARAHAWELRLQDELRPDFTIEEANASEHRARFVSEHPALVRANIEKEEKRRERKSQRDEPSESSESEVGEEAE
jgi:hypothetical protein